MTAQAREILFITNKMKEEFKGYIGIAIFLMVLWGIFGLIGGDGFFGGIEMQINAIGDIVSFVIKAALFLVLFGLFQHFLRRKIKMNKVLLIGNDINNINILTRKINLIIIKKL